MKRRLKRRAASLIQSFKAGLNLPDPSPAELQTGHTSGTEVHHLSPVFRFREKPFFSKKSIVKISRPKAVLIIEAHKSFLDRGNFSAQFIRLNQVLQYYAPGVSRILDHSESLGRSPHFHLDLSDAKHEASQEITPADHYYAFTRRRHQNAIGLLPDPYTLGDMSEHVQFPGYESEQAAMSEYRNRAGLIFWRGATTGAKKMNDAFTNQRIQFCMDSLNYPGLADAKITRVVQFRNNQKVLQELQGAGVMGTRVLEKDFSAYKATIDLDGNSAAWGVFRKYLRLVHVIKPDSEFEMFYSINQPENSLTRIKGANSLFQALEKNANLVDNFSTAWSGYQYAQEVRQKIREGNATVFPA